MRSSDFGSISEEDTKTQVENHGHQSVSHKYTKSAGNRDIKFKTFRPALHLSGFAQRCATLAEQVDLDYLHGAVPEAFDDRQGGFVFLLLQKMIDGVQDGVHQLVTCHGRPQSPIQHRRVLHIRSEVVCHTE